MKNLINTIFALDFIVILVSSASGNRGYSFTDCTYVKPDSPSTFYGSRCFRYTSSGIKWKHYWSTFQVHVSSSEDVVIVYPMNRTCHDAENLLQLIMCETERHWPFRFQKESSVDLPLLEEEVFFMAKAPRASAEYTLNVHKHRFNRMRFFLFICGLMLFFWAGTLCRSSILFYISGVSLGITSITLFLLLVLRSFIPSRGLFLLLFGSTCGLSFMIIQYLIMERKEILSLYWKELLGYLLVSGVVSLLVCYRQGPVTSKRTLSVMTWLLQVVGVALACHGVTYSPLSWNLLILLLGMKILPLLITIVLAVLGQVFWLLWTFLALFQRRSSYRRGLLTEEEYREQAERHTRASLEELRRYCSNPDFPAWDTVLRLRTPHRFAEFLRSGAHVMASEVQSHELHKHTGFGPEFHENTLPTHTRTEWTDSSDGEINSHTSNTPSLSSSPPPLPFPHALHSPDTWVTPVYHYPSIQYTTPPCPPSVPEHPLTDEDEPF